MPDGTSVTASIGGVQYAATTTTGGGWYAIDVPGDDPDIPGKDGGEPGDTVVFTVDGCPASPTGTWASGVSERLDLSVTLFTWYRDSDNDTYGDPNVSQQACIQPPGYALDNTDCDDGNANINPGATEVCNGIDDDCDTLVDDDDPSCTGQPTWYHDADDDGYTNNSDTQDACDDPDGAGTEWVDTSTTNDCDDSNAAVNPGATEICNGIDDDCDTLVDDDDPDCTGQPTWYQDSDGDTYGNPAVSQEACTQPAGYVADNTDCDDTNGAVNPGATEVCNGIDDDCDGYVDCTDDDCLSPISVADGPYSGDRTETVTLDGSGSSDPDGTIATYEWWVGGSTVYAGPSATYDLDLSGYSLGDHTVTLSVTDDAGCTDDDTTTLTVSNAPPVANDDSAITDEDTPVNINVTANDTDDGTIDPTTVSIVSGSSHGSASVDPVSGEVTYTPDPDYNGADSFTYTVNDDDGATSNEATVTVTVNPEHGTATIVTLAPASKTISAGASIAYTVWATDTLGNSWDATAEATYDIDAGAGGSWGVIAVQRFSDDNEQVFEARPGGVGENVPLVALADNVYMSEFAGTWTVTATVDGVDGTATLTVEHGTATTVTLSPASETVTAGQSITYTVWATDTCGNSWDTTSTAAYTITPDAGGSWAANVYTSQFAGDWTVTATVDGVDDDATLTVEHGTATTVALSPASETVTAGDAVTYTVWATDTLGNGWDATAEADYDIDASAGGSWADNVYTSEIAGNWTVMATVDGTDGIATLTVGYGAAATVTLSPASATITAGQSVTYTVWATDTLGNSWDATASAAYTVTTGAGGSWTDNVYTSELAGTWTVTATVDGVDDTATLTVEHGTAMTVALSPALETVTAGDAVTYTVCATDTLGNGWDATAEADYDIDASAGGSWADNVYTSEFVGTWTVTATVDSVDDTATLTVTNPAPFLTSLNPISATAGGPAFTLTVNGTNFVAGSTVHWNGAPRTTTFVNSTQLRADITALDIATVGTASVTVFNPAPGGGTSNPLPFEIVEFGPPPPSDFIYLPLVSRNATP